MLESKIENPPVKKILERYPLIPLLVLFVFLRVFWILFADPLKLFIFYTEELYRGAMALEFLDGGFPALFRFRPDDYAAGSEVLAVLASLFFRGLPASLFSLKLVSVFWAGLALVAWHHAIKRFDHLKTANLFALIFIFSPPAFLRYTLAPIGDHAETILFTGLELCLLHPILFKQKNAFVYAGFLGIIAGFGVCFAYIHVFSVLTLIIFWRWHEINLFRSKPFLIFSIFLFLGLSPALVFNLLEQGAGLIVQGKPVWQSLSLKNSASRILHFRSFTGYQLFSYFDLFDYPFTASKLTIQYYRILFCLPMGLALWNYLKGAPSLRSGFRQHPFLFFSLLYLTLFCTLVQFSEFVAVRYFIPVQPLLFYLAAFSISALSKKNPKILLTFSIFLVLGGVYFQGRMLSPSQRGWAIEKPGFSYAWITGSPACATAQKCLETYRHFEDKLTPDDKWTVSLDLSLTIASELPFLKLQEELDAAERAIPLRLRSVFYYAFGYEIFARHQNDLEEAFNVVKSVRSRSETLYQLSVLGLIHCAVGGPKKVSLDESLALERLVPAFAVSEYWRRRGLEWAQSVSLQQDPPPIQKFEQKIAPILLALSKKQGRHFLRGIGESIFESWSYGRGTDFLSFEEFLSLPASIQKNLLIGAGISSTKPAYWDKTILLHTFMRKIPSGLRQEVLQSANRRFKFLAARGYSF